MTHARASLSAFTLVEMLVAVFVIAILVTVVVGVSGHVVRRSAVEHTRSSMEVISAAMEAYHRVTGSYPAEPTEVSIPLPGWGKRDWQAYMRGKALYDQLMGVAASQRALDTRAADAVAIPQGGNRTFVDGFRKYMDYFQSKGARGTPLLLSAGLDGDFHRQEDNIRSDDL